MKQRQTATISSGCIVYAREDEQHFQRLRMWLRPMQRDGLITEWHEYRMSAGTLLREDINSHLETASVILLLISPSFLALYSRGKLDIRHALEWHARGEVRIIPIILRPASWRETFGDLQTLPRSGKPVSLWSDTDKAFIEIEQDIRRICREPLVSNVESSSQGVPHTYAISSSTAVSSTNGNPSKKISRPLFLPRFSLSPVSIFGLLIIIILILVLPPSIMIFSSFFPQDPSIRKDIHIPNLQVQQKIEPLMKVNHSYKATIVLYSLQRDTPLSALEGSFVEGQTAPLSVLLGPNTTPCISASLLVNPTAFHVEPSQSQEYSLQQSQITWTWNITPLLAAQQTVQNIPVQIHITGKLRCGSRESLIGPFPLLSDPLFTVSVSGDLPAASPPGLPMPVLWFIGSFLAIVIVPLLGVLGQRVWQKRKRQNILRKDSSLEKPFRGSSMKKAELENHGATSPLSTLLRHEQESEGKSLVSHLHMNQNKGNSDKLQMEEKPLLLFYCYSPADKNFCDQLDKQLSALKGLGWIESWSESEIAPGAAWEEEMKQKLESADIILLLVSSDFVTSGYRYDHLMPRALERHKANEATVIPVILRPTYWKLTSFGFLHPLPSLGEPVSKWANQDEAFLNITQGIRKVVDSLRTQRETNLPTE